jgi:hypothetical protein
MGRGFWLVLPLSPLCVGPMIDTIVEIEENLLNPHTRRRETQCLRGAWEYAMAITFDH